MSYPHQSTDDPPRVRELEVAEVGQLTSDTQIFGTSIRLDVLNEGIHVAVHGATVLDRLIATTVLRRLFCFRVLCSPHSVLPQRLPMCPPIPHASKVASCEERGGDRYCSERGRGGAEQWRDATIPIQRTRTTEVRGWTPSRRRVARRGGTPRNLVRAWRTGFLC